MSDALDLQIRALFEQAAAIPRDQRAAFLQRVRSEHPQVAPELEALLDCHDRAGGLLDRAPALAGLPASSTLPTTDASTRPTLQITTGADAPAALGPWRIAGALRAGGTFLAFRVEHNDDHRIAAARVVRPELVTPAIRGRFAAAASGAPRWPWPSGPAFAHVLEIIASSPNIDGPQALAIISRWVDGPTLAEATRDLDLSIAARHAIAIDLCQAVASAHAAGVVCGELSPRDIRLESQDDSGCLFPVLMAAGLWRLIDGENLPNPGVSPGRGRSGVLAAAGGVGLSRVRSVSVSTAPELSDGQAVAPSTATDIYALGAVLHELFTGRPPALSVLRAAPWPRPTVFAEPVVRRALNADPSARWPDAAAMHAALAATTVPHPEPGLLSRLRQRLRFGAKS